MVEPKARFWSQRSCSLLSKQSAGTVFGNQTKSLILQLLMIRHSWPTCNYFFMFKVVKIKCWQTGTWKIQTETFLWFSNIVVYNLTCDLGLTAGGGGTGTLPGLGPRLRPVVNAPPWCPPEAGLPFDFHISSSFSGFVLLLKIESSTQPAKIHHSISHKTIWYIFL